MATNKRKTKQPKLLKTIETLQDFVAVIEKNCRADVVLFRGQAQPWPLLPKIARIMPVPPVNYVLPDNVELSASGVYPP